jgi:hypothetical protein
VEILEIYPKDVYVKLELSLKEIEYLLDFLGNSVMSLDKEKSEMVEAASYIQTQFYPKLNDLSKDLREGRFGSH